MNIIEYYPFHKEKHELSVNKQISSIFRSLSAKQKGSVISGFRKVNISLDIVQKKMFCLATNLLWLLWISSLRGHKAPLPHELPHEF